MYELIKKDGRAKRGRFHTVHGTIETPVFMNVGTAAAIKGAVSTDDLRGIKTQVELSNTYHLHVRPGDEVVKKMGGLHKFMNWDKPILTDSGGFHIFLGFIITLVYVIHLYLKGKLAFVSVLLSLNLWYLPLILLLLYYFIVSSSIYLFFRVLNYVVNMFR